MNAFARPNAPIDLSRLASISQVARHPEKTSERYGFIPTAEVIEVIKEQGLVPVSARQAHTRAEANHGYQKHMISFRFGRDIGRTFDLGEEIPQLLLVNSHMGSASFQFFLGLFRCACSNQLMVSSASLVDIRIAHNKYAAEKVHDGVTQILEALPMIDDQVKRFKAIELTPNEQNVFAEAVIPLRFDTESHDINPRDMLRTRRQADRAPTLWNTFNVLQENVIRGGVQTVARDPHATRRRSSARAVNGLSDNIRLNKALWTLTEKMAELRA